jgi:hypothetical protein
MSRRALLLASLGAVLSLGRPEPRWRPVFEEYWTPEGAHGYRKIWRLVAG